MSLKYEPSSESLHKTPNPNLIQEEEAEEEEKEEDRGKGSDEEDPVMLSMESVADACFL